MTLPGEPPAPFTARPATADDAPGIAALVNAFERAQVEEPDLISVDELAGWWARIDLAGDSLLVSGPSGEPVAFGTLDRRAPTALDLDPCVHPDHTGRGLGSFLLDWAQGEARSRGWPAVRTSALASDRAATRLLAARGFAPVRHFYRMLIDLDGPPPEPAWPDGFAVSTFAPGEEKILHAVVEETFADHWGHVPRDLDEWQQTVFGREWWDPSLTYLVRAGDEVVAAEINAVRFGMGWIGTLGTRKPWRGCGLGRALLLLAFGELYGRGERRIGLAVDAGNETGATHLYESVGMRVAWQADVYERRM